MAALRFAVVGLGMGKHHCAAVHKAEGAELVAVCDLDPARREPVAARYGVKAYDEFRKVLKDPEVDVVCIATESGKHAQMGVAAARAGKHIIVEKPLDITPAKMRKLEDAIAETGVKCGCIFQTRLDNAVSLIKKALERGDMGRVLGAHGWLPWFREQAYYQGPHGSWKGTWKMDGGGSLMNQGIHTLDNLVYLAGEVQSVCGFYGTFTHDIEAEDQTVAALQFKSGALGTLLTSTCCMPENSQRFYMYGTEGSFSRVGGVLESYAMGPEEDRARMMALFSATPDDAAINRDPLAVSADGHMVIVQDLVKAVREDRDPVIPVASAKHAVEVATAIYKSVRTRRVVDVDSVKR